MKKIIVLGLLALSYNSFAEPCVTTPPPSYVKMVCKPVGQDENVIALVCTKDSIEKSAQSLVAMQEWQYKTYGKCGPKTIK